MSDPVQDEPILALESLRLGDRLGTLPRARSYSVNRQEQIPTNLVR